MIRFLAAVIATGMIGGCGLVDGAPGNAKFEFRGLSEDTTLEQAEAAGIVSDCGPVRVLPTDPRELQNMPVGGFANAPIDPNKRNCRLADPSFAGVRTSSTFVQFDHGKLSTLRVTVPNSSFDAAVRSLRGAYGEPCTVENAETTVSRRLDGDERAALDRGYGSIPSEVSRKQVSDNPRWCFAGGSLLGRRFTHTAGESSFSYPATRPSSSSTPDDI